MGTLADTGTRLTRLRSLGGRMGTQEPRPGGLLLHPPPWLPSVTETISSHTSPSSAFPSRPAGSLLLLLSRST